MSRFWRLLETGLRVCAHSGGVQDKNAATVLGSCGSGMDRVVLRAVFLDFLDFAGAFGKYLTSFVNYWIESRIYEIYVDLLIEE